MNVRADDLPKLLVRHKVFPAGQLHYCAACGHNVQLHDVRTRPWACWYAHCSGCTGLTNEHLTAYLEQWAAKRSARVRPSIPEPVRAAVLARDGMTCRYCLRRVHRRKRGPGRIHFDHVLPRSLGGPDTPENLVVSCARCNLSKHDDPTIVPADWSPVA